METICFFGVLLLAFLTSLGRVRDVFSQVWGFGGPSLLGGEDSPTMCGSAHMDGWELTRLCGEVCLCMGDECMGLCMCLPCVAIFDSLSCPPLITSLTRDIDFLFYFIFLWYYGIHYGIKVNA